MKTKNMLILCEDLKYFDKWCNTIQGWYNKTASRRTRNTLHITINDSTVICTAYTPRMSKETLMGSRFDEIVDNIGLSDSEKMWFDLLVRPTITTNPLN